MQLRIQPHSHRSHIPLTDQHVGPLANHRLIATANVADPGAQLLVRDHYYGAATEIPREQWRFAVDNAGEAVADDSHVWLAGGFEAGKVYDLHLYPCAMPLEQHGPGGIVCAVVPVMVISVRNAAGAARAWRPYATWAIF